MKYTATDLKEMSNVVRSDALRAVLSANSGHVGIVLGAADIITAIYANFLRRGRDKFVLSAGHGSAMLYAALKLAGYRLPPLETFRKIGGLPGHPEYGLDGVDATTGPLGQGVGAAVGMALAEKIKKSDGRVYCLCSDGDLMEGVAQEAVAFAGRYKLNNLIMLWDDNGISIDGAAQVDIDVPARMRAAGWTVMSIDGDDAATLNRVLRDAAKHARPTFIQCKTQIGAASSVAGTPRAHGYGLGTAEMTRLIEGFDSVRGRELWAAMALAATDVMAPDAFTGPVDVAAPAAPEHISTRELSGMYLDALLTAGIPLVGGSADLGGSTNAKVKASIEITPDDFCGNYINYGVREHAMGAIMNGLAACGLRPYGSTFLVFSDYMRPAMRVAAISGLPVIYVLTHDSVAVGEDGPTHQPIEQLPSLRMMPNMNVFRPCNMAEIAYAYRTAIANGTRPTSIILSRQKIRQIPSPVDADMARGAYIIRPARGRDVKITLLATGAEVPLAVLVAEKLGPDVQVASVPCVAAFRGAPAEYKARILRGRVIAIEAAAAAPWFEFADAVVGIDRFGLSGDGDAVLSALGFDADAIARDVLRAVK